MVLHNPLRDSQSQAAASRRRAVSPVELFEDMRYFLRRNSLPLVCNFQADRSGRGGSRNRQMPLSIRIPYGIVQDVLQDLPDSNPIGGNRGQGSGNIDIDFKALFLQISIEAVQRVLE